jgi:hypothetical protein
MIMAEILTCASQDVAKRTDKYVQNNGGHFHHLYVLHIQ